MRTATGTLARPPRPTAIGNGGGLPLLFSTTSVTPASPAAPCAKSRASGIWLPAAHVPPSPAGFVDVVTTFGGQWVRLVAVASTKPTEAVVTGGTVI
jgi:hypothetical protein